MSIVVVFLLFPVVTTQSVTVFSTVSFSLNSVNEAKFNEERSVFFSVNAKTSVHLLLILNNLLLETSVQGVCRGVQSRIKIENVKLS